MVWKENLAKFEKSNISKTKEATSTKIGLHAFDINTYLHEFFEPIQSVTFLVHGRKGNLAVFESSNISETREATSTKIGMHAFDINPYLHELFNQFYSIKFFHYHGL